MKNSFKVFYKIWAWSDAGHMGNIDLQYYIFIVFFFFCSSISKPNIIA